MTATVTKRGRKEIFAKAELLVAVLAEIQNGAPEGAKPVATRFLTERLAEAGLVKFRNVKGEGRGRPRKVASLTYKGRTKMERIAARIVAEA